MAGIAPQRNPAGVDPGAQNAVQTRDIRSDDRDEPYLVVVRTGMGCG
jgi:hypothetical protein